VLQCLAVCCSVLQCVAVCWSVLQCVEVRCIHTCNVSKHFTYLIVLQCVAVCCSALQSQWESLETHCMPLYTLSDNTNNKEQTHCMPLCALFDNTRKKQQTQNNKQQTQNNKQQTQSNKQQTTNTKQAAHATCSRQQRHLLIASAVHQIHYGRAGVPPCAAYPPLAPYPLLRWESPARTISTLAAQACGSTPQLGAQADGSAPPSPLLPRSYMCLTKRGVCLTKRRVLEGGEE